jgi:uncharacterized protein
VTRHDQTPEAQAAGVVAPSHESAIVLDREGRFWHEGEEIRHPGLVGAFRRWLRAGPDGHPILEAAPGNWCTLRVEGAALFVDRVRVEPDRVVLGLWDGTEEPLDPSTLRLGPEGALHCRVRGLEARFGRDAHFKLGGHLEPAGSGGFVLRLGDEQFSVA